MKTLKNEQKVEYPDLQELKCSVCNTRIWDQGPNVAKHGRVKCPQCGTLYLFEPTRWKVFVM